MFLLCLISVSVAVGYLAQTRKGRTGVAWGALTAVVAVALWTAVALAQASRPPSDSERAMEARFGAGASGTFDGVVTVLLAGALMAGVVLTLPKPKP